MVIEFDSLGYIKNKKDLSKGYILKITKKIKEYTKATHSNISNIIVIKDKNNVQVIDLINLVNKLDNHKDWDYEYIESICKTNVPYEIAFITHNPTYGIQGVKIFNFKTPTNPVLVYEMEDFHFTGAMHHLVFNQEGSRYSLLLYDYDNNTNFITVCEYEVLENQSILNKRPLNYHKTNLCYLGLTIEKTTYKDYKTLCITRSTDMVIFNLTYGKITEIKKK